MGGRISLLWELRKRGKCTKQSQGTPPHAPAKRQVATGSSVGLDGLGVPWVTCGFPFFLKFYLFMRDTERKADIGRWRSRLLAGSPMWDSIPGLWDGNLAEGIWPTTEPPGCPSSWVPWWVGAPRFGSSRLSTSVTGQCQHSSPQMGKHIPVEVLAVASEAASPWGLVISWPLEQS